MLCRHLALPAKPDPATYASLLRRFRDAQALRNGRILHDHIIRIAVERGPFLECLLLQMYSACGALEDGAAWFSYSHERGNYLWNVMIGAHGRTEEGAQKALDLFQQMLQEGVLPDQVTFVGLLTACSSLADLKQGQYAHAQAGYETNIVVETATVSMYGKCGSLRDAQCAFNDMIFHNAVTLNAMIATLNQHGLAMHSLGLFQQMQQEGVLPSNITYINILNACADLGALYEGKRIHALVTQLHLELDVVMKTSLMNMYSNCCELEKAQSIFDELQECNLIMCNALISAYALEGFDEEADVIFKRMLREGAPPNKVTFITILNTCRSEEALFYGKRIHACILFTGFDLDMVLANALLTMYSKCGSIEEAERFFNCMSNCNVVSWSAMIEMYSSYGYQKQAVELFYLMPRKGISPNKVTYTSVISAVSHEEFLDKSREVHNSAIRQGFDLDTVVGTSLVNMYGKWGSLGEAASVFSRLNNRDVVAWNAMVDLCAEDGNAELSLYLVSQMSERGLLPNNSTFVSILAACATQAALTIGKVMHNSIVQSGAEKDVLVSTSLVNMYRKCGGVNEARAVFERMAERNIISWNAMITGYAQNGHGKEALELFLLMREEGETPDRTTLSSVVSACSHSGLVEEGASFIFSVAQGHGITLAADYFDCCLSLFARAGQLEQAEYFVNTMPVQPSGISWMSLLSTCRTASDIKVGERAAKHVLEMGWKDLAFYKVLSGLYATVDMLLDDECTCFAN